jgi:hypothetical protein
MEADRTLSICVSDLSGPVCSNQTGLSESVELRKWRRDRMIHDTSRAARAVPAPIFILYIHE